MKNTPVPLPKLAAPAIRALHGVKITTLDQLRQLTEEELVQLHGIGPNAVKVLKLAMQQHGYAFKKD